MAVSTKTNNKTAPRTSAQAAKPISAERAIYGEDATADDIFGSALAGYADKERLAADRVQFILTAVDTRVDEEYGEQWVLSITLTATNEPLKLTMLVHEKRDAQMEAAQRLIARSGPIANLVLRKSKDAFYINRAAASA